MRYTLGNPPALARACALFSGGGAPFDADKWQPRRADLAEGHSPLEPGGVCDVSPMPTKGSRIAKTHRFKGRPSSAIAHPVAPYAVQLVGPWNPEVATSSRDAPTPGTPAAPRVVCPRERETEGGMVVVRGQEAYDRCVN